MPNWFRGEYELIAERVLNRNALDLNIDPSSDSVYENQIVSADTEFDEDHLYLPPSDQVSYLSKFFTISDFLIQVAIFTLMTFSILSKEGFTDLMSPDSALYTTLKNLGLTKNLSLISLFTLAHLNQSKYIGISKIDSFQYITIRLLPFMLCLLIIVRADYVGNIKHHFEQLLVAIFYLTYFIVKDYKNSRRNQLQKFFDSELNDSEDNDGYKKQYDQKKETRMVLIMYRERGNGGIQGIVIDSFYMDKEGRIA